MDYDGKINIATGHSAKTRVWKNKTILWSEMVKRLTEENKTNETFKEFISASKEDQSKIKDVGGYVGGYLRNGKRSPQHVVHRTLLTLDIDFAYSEFWEDFCMQYDSAAVIHATHKYSQENPRYRLILPLDREVTPDEYVAIGRRVAGDLGIDLFDNTTFETNRLMFWPSSPKDVEYYAETQDGPWLNVDATLERYIDWTDSALWPTSQTKFDETKAEAKKLEDPANKKGVIGAFCRTYSISEAIEEFLSDDYEYLGNDRYTYRKGTTAAGMIAYDDKFAFSHHGTDPSGGKLCNSFDLVRIHRFGHLDEVLNHTAKAKSFKAMEEFCTEDKKVKGTIARETVKNASYDFEEDLKDDAVEHIEAEPDLTWMEELEVDGKGNYLSTANNINMIFANDERFAGLFKQNDFDGKRYIFKSVPWRKVSKPEPVKNVDYSGVRNYIESIYGITGNLKIDDSLALEFEKNHYHPVKEYLSGIKWDGIGRIDTLLVDFFGAEDSTYTREATRKALVGAVARIFHPGVKFDLVLTLVGAQGTGKSTFFKKLGKSWFSDTFMTVNGKEALEQIQGSWLIEMAELAGLRKAEVESVKHFISKQEDIFRPAYARTSETYPRQCVFFGTTNSKDFLRDPSGNRRFMPVDVDPDNCLGSVFSKEFDECVDQVWAEAVYLYKKGEPLYLSREAEGLARIEQVRHSEQDERTGLIEDYLNKLYPSDWGDMDLFERRDFLSDPLKSKKGEKQKKYTCIAEIWCECLGKEKDSMDRYKTREINDIMRSLDGWEQSRSTKNFKVYGKQKYYVRVEED